MTILQAFILGIVQGITEFLPISSSGHLVLVPYLLDWQLPEEQVFVFDVLVQIGTLVAVIIYFRQDLWSILSVTVSSLKKPDATQKLEVRLFIFIVLASVPAVIFGLLLKEVVRSAFSNPSITVLSLIFTAVLLIIAEQAGRRTKTFDQIGWLDALLMGLFQVLSLFPGVSRSGSTITGGMLRDLDRPAAARFSFLMAIPVMVGAGVVAALDLTSTPDLINFIFPLTVGFLTAAVVGYLSIHWLLRFLANHPLYYFSIFLIALTTLILVFK